MARLRSAFEALGFKSVKTLIQSGNVVFTAPRALESALCRRIEAKLSKEFGFPIPVIVRTADEVKTIVSSNPLLKQKGINVSRLHIIFLAEEPPAEALKKVESLALPSEQFRCVGRDLYLYLPDGFARTKLTPGVFDKSLAVSATARNWNTMTKLCELCGPQS